jgi:hypothetical protein
MKKISISLFALLLSISLFAIDVPKNVKAAFAKKFPTATNVKWDKENAHEYEAGFKLDGKNYSANYSTDGVWLETESTVEFASLPEKVQQAFKANFKNAIIHAAAKIENSKAEIKYEIEYKIGKKTKEVLYGEDGSITK